MSARDANQDEANDRALLEQAPAPRPPKTRVCYLPSPHFFNLNTACVVINEAFGPFGCYLVGSSLERRDYRDVDVRFIMDDAEFARLFGCEPGTAYLNARWSLLCSSISCWLQKQTGLPIDFQIQQQTAANAEYGRGQGRHPLGFHISTNPPDYAKDFEEERQQ